MAEEDELKEEVRRKEEEKADAATIRRLWYVAPSSKTLCAETGGPLSYLAYWCALQGGPLANLAWRLFIIRHLNGNLLQTVIFGKF